MATDTYSIQQLENATGVQARTLRHWIRRKLLPKPSGRGRGAHYGADHLLRARVIRELRSKRMSLAAIRSRMGSLTDDQLRSLVPAEPRPTTPEGLPVPPPAPSYPSVLWEVVNLMDGLVLLVSSKHASARRIADEIYKYYGAPPRPETPIG